MVLGKILFGQKYSHVKKYLDLQKEDDHHQKVETQEAETKDTPPKIYIRPNREMLLYNQKSPPNLDNYYSDERYTIKCHESSKKGLWLVYTVECPQDEAAIISLGETHYPNHE